MNLNSMFGKINSGMCRISMNGEIAVKTDSGYKTYDFKTMSLINCDRFVFDIGEDFFFLIPTNKVEPGDIILIGGKPKCVTNVSKNILTVVNYENGSVETVIPERHIFMGNTYFYGKIVSMFGNLKGGTKNIMKYMMLSEMMKGNNGNMSNMLPMMMLGGNGFGDMFDGMFDFDTTVDDEAVEAEDEE